MNLKTKRIASQIGREIGLILNEEAKNEILKMVSVTDVTLDSDLTFAKVYFMTRLEEHEKVEAELNEASGFIRRELAHRLDLRSTPELKFVYDKSADYARNIDEIMEEIKDND